MVAGGNPPMRPDQALQPLSRAGTGPAPQSQVFVGRLVVITGPNGLPSIVISNGGTGPAGITTPAVIFFNSAGAVLEVIDPAAGGTFQYQDLGTSVQGVLIGASVSKNTTDPITHVSVPAGIFVADPVFGDTLRIVGANAVFEQTTWLTGALVAASGGTPAGNVGPALALSAPTVTGSPGVVNASLFGQSANGLLAAGLVLSTASPPVKETSAMVEVQGTIATTATVEAIVSGAVETWHTAGLAAGFAALGAPFATPGYQLEPINGGRVRLRGQVSLTANQAALTTIFTLSVGYRPTFVQNFVTNTNLNGYALGNTTIQVGTAGQVVMVPSGLTGNSVGLDGVVIELD